MPTVSWLQNLKDKMRSVRREVFGLYLALKHPRTPWYAKACAVLVIAYALSPVDLIPDPVPVLGYLDDIILVPLGVVLVRRLVPPDVLEECRQQAQQGVQVPRGYVWAGGAFIGLVWALCLGLGAWRLGVWAGWWG